MRALRFADAHHRDVPAGPPLTPTPIIHRRNIRRDYHLCATPLTPVYFAEFPQGFVVVWRILR